VQPAMAVVWSFLLLGETLRGRQMLGIAVSMSGLLAFLVVHERGARARRAAERVGEAEPPAPPAAAPAVAPDAAAQGGSFTPRPPA